jgi:hypothetical protein
MDERLSVGRYHIRDLVDRHLTNQIDYRLVDYHRATSTYLQLTDEIHALSPNTNAEGGGFHPGERSADRKGAERSSRSTRDSM